MAQSPRDCRAGLCPQPARNLLSEAQSANRSAVMTGERAAREELDRLTRKQAALRRELAAAAIANARAHAELRRVRAELAASQARIAAAADETRRRIERDLHDGAQQWLVTLALRLRVVQASVPPDLAELRAELGQVAAALTSALDELRQYARHPSGDPGRAWSCRRADGAGPPLARPGTARRPDRCAATRAH